MICNCQQQIYVIRWNIYFAAANKVPVCKPIIAIKSGHWYDF